MAYFQRILSTVALMVGILCSGYSAAEITVEPIGFAVSLDQYEGTEIELTLTNTGEEDVEFIITLSDPDDEGERRDPDFEPWELRESWELEEIVDDNMLNGVVFADDHYYISGGNNGDEPNKIYVLNVNGEVVEEFDQFAESRYGMRDLAFDGELIWGGDEGTLYGFNTEGEHVVSLELDIENFEGRSLAWDTDREVLWVTDISTDIYGFNRDGELVRTIENEALRIYGLANFPDDPDGCNLYVFCRGPNNQGIAVYKIDIENEDFREVVELDVESRPSGIQITDQYDDQSWVVVGIVQNPDCLNVWSLAETGHWLQIDHDEGIIEGNESETVDIMFASGGMEEGVYEMYVMIELVDEESLIMISAIMSVDSPVANVYGEVFGFDNGVSIEGAMLDVTDHYFTCFTDYEGEFSLDNLPLGDYEITISATDYLTTVEEFSIDEEGDFEWYIELLHSECTPSENRYYHRLEPDTQREIEFRVDNGGNGPLTYQVERRLLGYNADPFELRLSYELEDTTGDDLLEGAVYIDGYFYISGGNNGEDVNKIYVLNMDGEIVNEFDQFAESRYGIRDLAYDGNLIWGADGGTFYGFTTEGELETSFEFIPVDNFEGRSIAWDSENEVLISSDIETDIYAINRNGELIETYERPEELRIYGLDYWFDDPDGYNLYAFCRGQDNVGVNVFKLDIVSGDYMLAAYIDVEGRPAGFQITNQLDVYSWVIVALVQNPDRLNIWQLDARKDWFQVEPTEGVIEADEFENFVLTLDATDLYLDQTCEGEVVFIHNGIGGETPIYVTLEVYANDDPRNDFNLIEPENDDTLYTGEEKTFTWQTIDPYEEIDDSYLLWFRCYPTNDSISIALLDTFMQVLPDTGIFLVSLEASFQWWVQAVSGDDTIECNNRFDFDLHGGNSINNQELDIPKEFAIQAAYPNPFNSQMQVSYSLLESGIIDLAAYDLSGRRVAELLSGRQSAGSHTALFDGVGMPSGVYMLRLQSGGQSSMMKVIILK